MSGRRSALLSLARARFVALLAAAAVSAEAASANLLRRALCPEPKPCACNCWCDPITFGTPIPMLITPPPGGTTAPPVLSLLDLGEQQQRLEALGATALGQ